MNESVLSMLSNRLAAGGQALCAWVTMNEPAVAEALAREAFDAIVLDMQHGAVDFDGATRSILRVALAGKPTIARVPIGAFALASQLMDSGACGILAPMIDSGEDARRLVEFRQIPAARAAILGSARRATAQRPGRFRLSQGGQCDDPGHRDD